MILQNKERLITLILYLYSLLLRSKRKLSHPAPATSPTFTTATIYTVEKMSSSKPIFPFPQFRPIFIKYRPAPNTIPPRQQLCPLPITPSNPSLNPGYLQTKEATSIADTMAKGITHNNWPTLLNTISMGNTKSSSPTISNSNCSNNISNRINR